MSLHEPRGTGMHLFAAPKHAPTKNAAPTHTRLTDHRRGVPARDHGDPDATMLQPGGRQQYTSAAKV